jgi:hypothetical protein
MEINSGCKNFGKDGNSSQIVGVSGSITSVPKKELFVDGEE